MPILIQMLNQSRAAGKALQGMEGGGGGGGEDKARAGLERELELTDGTWGESHGGWSSGDCHRGAGTKEGGSSSASGCHWPVAAHGRSCVGEAGRGLGGTKGLCCLRQFSLGSDH